MASGCYVRSRCRVAYTSQRSGRAGVATGDKSMNFVDIPAARSPMSLGLRSWSRGKRAFCKLVAVDLSTSKVSRNGRRMRHAGGGNTATRTTLPSCQLPGGHSTLRSIPGWNPCPIVGDQPLLKTSFAVPWHLIWRAPSSIKELLIDCHMRLSRGETKVRWRSRLALLKRGFFTVTTFDPGTITLVVVNAFRGHISTKTCHFCVNASARHS